MRLVRVGDAVRLLTVKTGVDLTDQLTRYALERVTGLASQDLCGFVLKKDSPSCGMERVKIYAQSPVPTKSGRGLFAATLQNRCPNLPIEEEGRLLDPRLRDNFVERVFAYGSLRPLFGRRWNHGTLVRFHTAHKLTLMAHSPVAYRQLGRLVAQGRSTPRQDLEPRATPERADAAQSCVISRRGGAALVRCRRDVRPIGQRFGCRPNSPFAEPRGYVLSCLFDRQERPGRHERDCWSWSGREDLNLTPRSPNGLTAASFWNAFANS